MNYCPPPLPPDAGELITSTVADSPAPTQLNARKCADGSWVVTVVTKEGVVNQLVVPPSEQHTK